MSGSIRRLVAASLLSAAASSCASNGFNSAAPTLDRPTLPAGFSLEGLRTDRPVAAKPWQDDGARRPQDGDVIMIPGAGVTSGPDTFLVTTQFDYYLGESLAIGPGIQVGVADDFFLVAPTFNCKWLFHLAQQGDLARVRPFMQGGVGFLYAEEEVRNRPDDDDVGVMLSGGVGVEFAARDNLRFGSTLTLQLMPSEVAGEHAFMSWQVLQVGFRF